VNFLDLAIKSVLAGTVGWTAIFLLRRSSASARHMTLFLTLIGVSLLPVISFFVPRWYVPFLKLNETAPAVSAHSGSGFPGSVTSVVAPVATTMPVDPMTVLLAVWIGVGVLLCVRMFVNLGRLSRAERKLAMSIDPGLQALVAERCRESGRHVLLLDGLENEPPMTWGHYRPVLVLPGDAGAWPEDRLNSVVLHELAHIERGDWLASMFAQLACAIYWFNPFVWVIRKQLEIESETAADDRVLSMGISATQYATHLVEVSKNISAGRSSTQVALAMARPGKLDRRIRAILESTRSRRTLRGSVTLALAASIVAIAGLLAAAAPTVIRQARQIPPDVKVSSSRVSSEDSTDPLGQGPADNNPDSGDQDQATDSANTLYSGDLNALPNRNLDSRAHTKSPDHAKEIVVPTPKVAPHPKLSTTPNLKPQPTTNPHSDPNLGLKVTGTDGPITVDFDMKEFGKEMENVKAEVESATKDAVKEIGASSVDRKAMMEGLNAFTKATTKLALESASKVSKASIQAALKEAKKVQVKKLSSSVSTH